MTFVRVSFMKPQVEEQEEVERINRELVAHYLGMKGCLSAYVLRDTGGAGEVCRLTLWESQGDADRAATDQHTMSLRSDLHRRIQPGDVGRSFVTV